MQTRGRLRPLGWKCDVKFADRRYLDARVTGEEMKQLIQRCTTDQVALVEDDFDWSPTLANWLGEFEDKSAVHVALQLPEAAKRGTRFFLWIYAWLVRLLLRTRKTFFRPGVVVFYRNQNFGDWINDSDEFQLHEFLSLARLKGRQVHETVLTTRRRPTKPIHSSHVLNRTKESLRFAWNILFFPDSSEPRNRGVQSYESAKLRREQQWFGWIVVLLAAICVLLSNLSFGGSQFFANNSPALSAIRHVAFLTFGVSELVGRLPNVLAAFFTVLVTIVLARRLIGLRAALIGGFMMLTSLGFVVGSRLGVADAFFSLFVTGAILTGYLAVYRKSLKPKWWILSGGCCGVGFLFAGLVAPIICITPLVLLSLTHSDHQVLRRFKNWLLYLGSAILGCVPMLIWQPQLLMIWPEWVPNQSGFQFLATFLIAAFPVTCLLPSLVNRLFGRTVEQRLGRSSNLGYLLIALTSITASLTLLASLGYRVSFMPLIPFTCLLVGWSIEKTVFLSSAKAYEATWLRKAPRRLGPVLFGLILAAQATVVFRFGQTQLFWGFLVIVPLILVALLRYSFRRRSPKEVAWLGLGAVALIFSFYCGSLLMPSLAGSGVISHSANGADGSLEILTSFFR